MSKCCCSSVREWCACADRESPSMYSLRRMFTLLAQYLFSDKERMAGFGDALECRTYDPAGINSGISIQPATVVDPGNTENIPGILVQLSEDGVKLEPLAMRPDVNESVDYASHEEVWKATATVQFRCRDKDADIAGQMADAMLLFVTAIRTRLLRYIGWLKDYSPGGATEPKLTKNELDDTSTERWYESVVSVDITFTYAVGVAEDSKRLKDFSLFTTDMEGNINP